MARHQTPQRAPHLLNNVIKEALQFLRHELQAQGVELRLQLTANLPKVQADRTLLQQLIVNLLINAMQAMASQPQGTRHIGISTSAGANGGIELRVTDSGPGIAPEHRERLFDSFFTTKANGLGLGLPICRTIVQEAGGTLEAGQAPDGGACFTVRFG